MIAKNLILRLPANQHCWINYDKGVIDLIADWSAYLFNKNLTIGKTLKTHSCGL